MPGMRHLLSTPDLQAGAKREAGRLNQPDERHVADERQDLAFKRGSVDDDLTTAGQQQVSKRRELAGTNGNAWSSYLAQQSQIGTPQQRSRVLAMQKVEGSNLFIRFSETPPSEWTPIAYR